MPFSHRTGSRGRPPGTEWPCTHRIANLALELALLLFNVLLPFERGTGDGADTVPRTR